MKSLQCKSEEENFKNDEFLEDPRQTSAGIIPCLEEKIFDLMYHQISRLICECIPPVILVRYRGHFQGSTMTALSGKDEFPFSNRHHLNDGSFLRRVYGGEWPQMWQRPTFRVCGQHHTKRGKITHSLDYCMGSYKSSYILLFSLLFSF